MISRPDYGALLEALDKADADLTTSESHGVLCGMYCATGKIDLITWLNQIFEEYDVTQPAVKAASQLLVGLYEDTKLQLADDNLSLQLMLPDDSESLAQRTEAIAAWCHGFTFGLAAGGIKDGQALPPDTTELIRDMVEISRAGHDLVEDSELDEEAYMQICEYVRVGVLLAHDELQHV